MTGKLLVALRMDPVWCKLLYHRLRIISENNPDTPSNVIVAHTIRQLGEAGFRYTLTPPNRLPVLDTRQVVNLLSYKNLLKLIANDPDAQWHVIPCDRAMGG